MGVTERLDRFQRQHPGASFPLAVVYKYVDDQGGYLAALIAYYAFLSLFPLLLLASTILGLVLSGNPHAQQQVLSSALHQFPVIGTQLDQPASVGGGTAGLIIGSLGALYGALGVANAIQNAMNSAWRIPKNTRPNPVKARGRSVLLLLLGVALLVTAALSAIGSGAGPYGTAVRTLGIVLSVVVDVAVFATVFRLATARPLTLGQVAPGAVAAAVIWQLLLGFGGTYVGHVVKHASATNSVFAVVLGLVAFLYLAAVALVFCVQVNVVRVEHLYPRALLTPFTDDVELTAGDRRAYRGAATAQRSKGFETVDVAFHEPAPTTEEPSTRSH